MVQILTLSCLWDTLEDRRNKHVFKLVKKCIKKNVPQFLQNYFVFNRDVVPRKTRQSNFLRVPLVRIGAAKRAFYYNGAV